MQKLVVLERFFTLRDSSKFSKYFIHTYIYTYIFYCLLRFIFIYIYIYIYDSHKLLQIYWQIMKLMKFMVKVKFET